MPIVVNQRLSRRVLAVTIPIMIVASVAVATPVRAHPAAATGSAPAVTVVHYDSTSLADYHTKWSNSFGPLDYATESFSNGVFTVRDVPFKPGTDFSVFDHLKYIAISNTAFPAPQRGAITFSVDIAASTPGAVAGHVVHGQYGPPGSYDPTNVSAQPYTSSVLEGQQAGVVLNMVDFCTGQLFDWFISSHYAFALIERLPTSVTGNTTNCPGASEVTLAKAYTQIVKNIPLARAAKHTVSITYSQGSGRSAVTYRLDGRPVATVQNVGVPLDKQAVPYTGIYPSLGNGEQLAGQIKSFSIGHGLFSLLDAFPFQYGCLPPSATGPGVCDPATAAYSVSIPPSQRSFGQGAQGSFSNFTVVTLGS